MGKLLNQIHQRDVDFSTGGQPAQSMLLFRNPILTYIFTRVDALNLNFSQSKHTFFKVLLFECIAHILISLCRFLLLWTLQTIFLQYLYLFPQAFEAIASSSGGIQTLHTEGKLN